MRARLGFKQHLACAYFVRFHMTLIVVASTAAGLLASKILLEAGLTNIFGRYPLSVLGSYLVFLGFTRLWSSYVLWRESAWQRGYAGSPDWLDLPDGVSLPGQSDADVFSGGGSGGAGASGWWEPSHSHPAADVDFDLGEAAALVIVLIGLMMVACGAGIYVIYWAPDILPELALNVLLGSCLTSVARKAPSRLWTYGVLRSTGIPLATVLVVSLGVAATLHHQCPGAVRITDLGMCVTKLIR